MIAHMKWKPLIPVMMMTEVHADATVVIIIIHAFDLLVWVHGVEANLNYSIIDI